ncbi:MAG TPA: hypothetical protein VHG93_21620 [Longimicrobium sp.]|nr:hypothetical protein [Longimicrobium sp.]
MIPLDEEARMVTDENFGEMLIAGVKQAMEHQQGLHADAKTRRRWRFEAPGRLADPESPPEDDPDPDPRRRW